MHFDPHCFTVVYQVMPHTGPLLRKFSIDELLQLFNIIKGEMVFVGPRPALYNQDDLANLRTKADIHKLIPICDNITKFNKIYLSSYIINLYIFLLHKSFLI